MRQILIALAILLIAAPASARFVDNTTYSRLLRAGDGGSICALYIGLTRTGFRNGDLFHRRACFSSRSKCRRWLREVQSRFPERQALRRCGTA